MDVAVKMEDQNRRGVKARRGKKANRWKVEGRKRGQDKQSMIRSAPSARGRQRD